jgi:putative tryptophan/tyrosine transport system substrate-binding protein
MRRRDLVAVLAGTAVIGRLAGAAAQSAKPPTIGILVHEAPGSEQFKVLFRQSLGELGYVDGRNVRFELRSDQGQVGRLPDLAAELVRLRVDVIVPWFTPAATAAKHATHDIAIVCAVCGDPVGTGLVESLARPGGNLTGIAGVVAELSSKSIDLIREIMPSARRMAALANAPDPFSKSFLGQILLAAKAAGTAIDPIPIHNLGELEAAFAAMGAKRPDAAIIQPSLPTKRAAELALRYRIPAVCAQKQFADDGGLMSYFAAEADMYRRAAVLVDKILKGARPADLPVEQPTKFELAVNLKTAKALGLTIPPSFLVRVDEVIE